MQVLTSLRLLLVSCYAGYLILDCAPTFATACRTLENAKKFSEGIKNASPISLDVSDEKALDAEVAKHALVNNHEFDVPMDM